MSTPIHPIPPTKLRAITPTWSRLEESAWIGRDLVKGRVKGLVLAFHGLGGGIKTGPNTEELEWSQLGALVVQPYYGPWAWMNPPARRMVDELVDALFKLCRLSDQAPLVATGYSMGGQGSLLYSRYARRPVTACLANCPVCDLAYHVHERPDVPPTVHHAFPDASGDFDEQVAAHSPLAQVQYLPDIHYRIIHGAADRSVSKQHHSDKLVAALRRRKLRVDYVTPAAMGHCGPMPLKVLAGNVAFVRDALSRSTR